ncbi:outer membrane beta-barrel protein [Akkermansiaceae bacterium]|nr:outer membrane beta-barrel protein [Akkermansiaceae bacterium]
MKKITATTLGLLSVSSLCAQSLFDLAPEDGETESSPLFWTVGASLGYDDNPTPGSDNETAYGVVYVGAAFLSQSPQTTVEFAGRLGYVHYFDDLDFGLLKVDQSTPTGSLRLNLTHRVNERLRLSSRNSMAFEYQPDYSIGSSAIRQTGAYTRWSSDNSVGYRWSERLGTYTGFIYDGVEYDNPAAQRNDISAITLYNDFRYQLSPQTVATLTYRYADRNTAGSARDTQNHFIMVGGEHRFSSNSVAIVRAGVQLRSIDGSTRDYTSPSAEAAVTTRVNQQLSVKAYGRLSTEDSSRQVGADVYDNANTMRLGVSGTYRVSQALSLSSGINYMSLAYEDGTAEDRDESLINVFVGFDLQIAENLYLNGSYNFEDLGSDVVSREYDRNRMSIGVRATF